MTDTMKGLSAALAGRYTLERELGRGGMATVYLATDLKHQRQVALKVLKPELVAALGGERFLREITLTAGLHHPHILPLLDSGEADGLLYYTMPFVAGESLRERLKREKQLPVEDALRLTREAADALDYAHRQGIIHRDIKPENILLEEGHALVADFGIARAVAATGAGKLTETGFAVGTPGYMSPEQATATKELDGRSDIYSLGCILYEMLAGHPPFTGASAQEVIARHTLDPVPRLAAARPVVSEAVEQVVSTALAKMPADRFATAGKLREALREGESGQYRSSAVGRRVSGRRVAIAAALVATVGALSLLAWALHDRPRPMRLTIGNTLPVTSDPELEIDPALSPDGGFIAYAGGPLLQTRIYVRQVDGGRPVAVGDSGGPAQRWPRWSPDGRRLLYCAGDKVMVAPAFGGAARMAVRADGDRLLGADWSPDGEAVAYADRDSLFVVTLSDGSRRALAGAPDVHSPAWSPDGKTVAFVSGNAAFVSAGTLGNIANSRILLGSVRGGPPTAVTDGRSLAGSPAWLADGSGLLFVSDLGGQRDVYRVRTEGAAGAPGPLERVTAGAGPHSITLSRDGRRLGYNVYSTKANIWTLPIPDTGVANASNARQLTRGRQKVESIAVSADGQWLYFDSDRSGRAELYRMRATGGEATQLTDADGGNFLPTPSPDGSQVAFQSQRNGNRDLFVMPAEGGGAAPVRVGPGHDNAPLWFPDGRRIGFTHYQGGLPGGFYVTDWTGEGWSSPRRLVKVVGVFMLAPDGREFLVGSGTWLGTVSLQGVPDADRMLLAWPKDSARLERYSWRGPGDPRVQMPRYGTDGRLYFQGAVGTERKIYFVPPRGGMMRPVVRFDDPSRQPVVPAFHADSSRFYFTLHEVEGDLWVADVRYQ